MPRPEDLLSALDPEQRQVAQVLKGPVVVTAGAGTGKTRAVTHRIAYGVATGLYQPAEVLAVTFTAKAAGELRERLAVLGAQGVQARTFHSAALRQVRYFWPHVFGGRAPELIRSKVPLLRQAVKRLGMSAGPDLIRDIAAEIEWAKVSNVRASTYPQIAVEEKRNVSSLSSTEVAELYSSYESVKYEAGRMDMEDILLANAAILSKDERVAAKVRQQYRWFTVDEYQDVNPLQSSLLDLWLGGRQDVCVVGDPRQTIYSFAGASQDYLRQFPRRFPQAERIELVRNYRSSNEIVAAANSVFDRTRVTGVRLISQQGSARPVSYTQYADEEAEALATAEQIRRLHADGTAYRNMAVLYRINAQSEAYQEALGTKKIPYAVRGDLRFFDRPEVRQAVTLLRGAAHHERVTGPASTTTSRAVADHAAAPDAAALNTAAQDDQSLVDDVRAILTQMGYTDEPPTGHGNMRDRWESLQTIMTMAHDVGPGGSLLDLVANIDKRAQTAHAPTMDGVTLATAHAAKGLEWDVVFCIGMHEGTMPLIHATTTEQIAEEQRLFYVALTRARHTLVVSWAAARSAQRRRNREDRKPSRFLDPLLPERHLGKTRSAKTAQDRLSNDDKALFEALRRWRREEVDNRKVPAFVIFNDNTLRSIAVRKPASLESLAEINGVGDKKLEEYGADIIRVINENIPARNQS